MWRHIERGSLLAVAGAGQPLPSGVPFSGILIWSAILLVVVVLAFLGYAQLKRWMNTSDDSTPEGFTFSDLRELHRQGKLSDQEYEAARAQLMATTKQAAGPLPDALSRRTPNPR